MLTERETTTKPAPNARPWSRGAPARPVRTLHLAARPWSPASHAAAACALALVGLQAACSDDDDTPAGAAGKAGAAAGPGGPSGGGSARAGGGAGGAAQGGAAQGGGAGQGDGAGQGGGPPGGLAPPNPAAAPLVDALTQALARGDEAALAARLGPGAFYVDASGRVEAPGASAALLSGGAWTLSSGVDSHHDVFRVKVQKGAGELTLFGGIDAVGRASWLALAAAPPEDPAATSPTVRAYQDAWNASDAAARAARIARSWSEDARYVDPTADARGRAGLDATIGGFRAAFPGANILASSGAFEAHGLVHFRWRLEGGGATPLDGMDVGLVGPSGTLTLIAGFFGPWPPR
jgi:hypothetical protein